jgi:ribose 1,5-bisphosphate isomerase
MSRKASGARKDKEILLLQAARDIRSMKVRGATAIARHAVLPLLRWSRSYGPEDATYRRRLVGFADLLEATRPTGVPLHNAMELARTASRRGGKRGAEAACQTFLEWSNTARTEIAALAADLIRRRSTVLTHCNSQAAIGAIIEAHRLGREVEAIATETRPWRQGLLTVKALAKARVPVSLIVDSAVAHFLAEVDVVMVGADAVARNGDVVNKIGTRLIAHAAKREKVPLYVCCETFKMDFRAATGRAIEIEEREATEIVRPGKIRDVEVRNPVFDVTPAALVGGYVTERGVVGARGVHKLAKAAFDAAAG